MTPGFDSTLAFRYFCSFFINHHTKQTTWEDPRQTLFKQQQQQHQHHHQQHQQHLPYHPSAAAAVSLSGEFLFSGWSATSNGSFSDQNPSLKYKGSTLTHNQPLLHFIWLAVAKSVRIRIADYKGWILNRKSDYNSQMAENWWSRNWCFRIVR